MYLHEKELVTQIRVYSSPDGYSNKRPYDAIFTLQYLGDYTVFIEGLRGRLGLKIKSQLRDIFKAKGITTVLYVRNGDLKSVKVS